MLMALLQSLMAALGFCILMYTLTHRWKRLEPVWSALQMSCGLTSAPPGRSPRPLGVKNGYPRAQLDGFCEQIQSFLKVAWNQKQERVIDRRSLLVLRIVFILVTSGSEWSRPSPRALIASIFFSLAWSIISSVTCRRVQIIYL